MRRLGFVIQHLNALGGTERAACAVMNGLAADADLHLFEVHTRGEAVFGLDPRVTRHNFFTRPVSLLNRWPQLVWKLARALRAARIDTLIVVESTHALYAVPAARLAGCRVIVWEHFNFRADISRRKRRLGRRIAARWADAIAVLTRRDINLWQHHAAPRGTMLYMPNIAPAPSDVAYDSTARRVIALGRLCHQKGFDRLLAAWSRVENDARGDGWRLDLYGDGPDKAPLEAQIARLARATLHPATKDVGPLYASAGLFAASSRFEGLPMVMLEAAAHGLPIVAFDCETGPAEIILPGKSGLLVKEGDVAGLAEGLLELMANPKERQCLSDGARCQATTFSRESCLARWRAALHLPAPPSIHSQPDEKRIEQRRRI